MADWNKIVQLPQISRDNMTAATVMLNGLGADGYSLKTVHTWGVRNRFATAGLVATLTRWEYVYVQFNYKDQNAGSARLRKLGDDGWELICLYGQGSDSNTGCAVLKRPVGPLEISVPSELVNETPEPVAKSASGDKDTERSATDEFVEGHELVGV